MSQVLALLTEMRGKRVAMYVGSTSLTLLAAFLRGYEHAIWQFQAGARDEFLAGFRDWVHRRFRTTQHSWEDTILLHSADEADAVKRFWELFDEYLRENHTDAVVLPPEAAANWPLGPKAKP